jgi:hypothetical protein
MKNSTLTVVLLLCNGFLLSLGIIPTILGLHSDATLETFLWVIIGSFQLLLMAFYSISRREEDSTLATSIENIEKLLKLIPPNQNPKRIRDNS